MQHFYNKIQGWFNFQDIYSEQVERAKDGFHFVEVGAWLGKSTAYMGVEIINSGKDIRFDVVDTWMGADTVKQKKYVSERDAYLDFTNNLRPILDHKDQFMTAIMMESVKASQLYEDGSLDFVFIDAAHDYENVKADIKAWLPKVKKGGVISGHDYSSTHAGLRKAVQESFNNFKTKGTSWIVTI